MRGETSKSSASSVLIPPDCPESACPGLPSSPCRGWRTAPPTSPRMSPGMSPRGLASRRNRQRKVSKRVKGENRRMAGRYERIGKKKRGLTVLVNPRRVVEAGGIEPPSRSSAPGASTCVCYLLVLAFAGSGRRDPASASSNRVLAAAPSSREQPLARCFSPRSPRGQELRDVATMLRSHCHLVIGSCVCARCFTRHPDNLGTHLLTHTARSNPVRPQARGQRPRAFRIPNSRFQISGDGRWRGQSGAGVRAS